jgi:DnaK suppressor protein
MNKVFIEKMKETLMAQKSAILVKSRQEHDIDSDGDETDEIQANQLIEMHNQLGTRDFIKLAEIDSALKRISESTYGICEDCEEPIPEKRLAVNPYFLTCVSCAEEREFEARQKKRS